MDTAARRNAEIDITPVLPSDEQADAILSLSAMLSVPKARKRPRYVLQGPNGEAAEIPPSVFNVLIQALAVLSRGDAVTIVPVEQELTTQQAANILNVSRQFLVRLTDDNKLACTKVGKHRRLKAADVFKYKARRHAERIKKLDELTQMSEDMGSYFEP